MAEDELLTYRDVKAGQYRFARLRGGQLIAALFVSKLPLAVSRSWAVGELSRPIAQADRLRLLAGRAGEDMPDPGATVCSCFEVGVNQIVEALGKKGCTSVDAVVRALGPARIAVRAVPKSRGLSMAQSSRKPVEVPPPRRALWDRLVGRAFGKVPYDKVRMSRLIKTARTAALCSAGRVTLVGAGPGDPELLTLKAVRALQSADVILFDDLVSDEVLELARRKAKRMLVGKRGGRQSCRQDDINDLMIKLAKQGKHVVRLKSGDPMIFGRAGEEIERLELEGIAVSAVPGISSGLAMAAELGFR